MLVRVVPDDGPGSLRSDGGGVVVAGAVGERAP
jgi:hypothetical protein